MLMDTVSVIQNLGLTYPVVPPFHPCVHYPEYFCGQLSSEPNRVYEAVRNSLIQLGLDQENVNTSRWNPFKALVTPGNAVLIKPNFVIHFHALGEDINCAITHPSVIRAAVDYVVIALKGKGRIIIGDAPIQSCRVEELLTANGLNSIIEFISRTTSIQIEFMDLREEVIRLEKHSIISERRRNSVPVIQVNLGSDSKLEEIIQDVSLFCVEGYNPDKTISSHGVGKHTYDIHALALQADAIINIPKLKTHKRAGLTAAIKSVVGFNANKSRLPHFRAGSPYNGGDEYPTTNILREWYRRIIQHMSRTDNRFQRYASVSALFLIRRIFDLAEFELIEGGSWPGNDTLWRMIYDLNKAVYYGDRDGRVHSNMQRKVFTVVDGFLAGEKQGPLGPSPKQCGLIISGFNPFLIDAVACGLMGFDYRQLKTVCNMQELFPASLENAEIVVNEANVAFQDLERFALPFVPATGWESIMKRTARQDA